MHSVLPMGADDRPLAGAHDLGGRSRASKNQMGAATGGHERRRALPSDGLPVTGGISRRAAALGGWKTGRRRPGRRRGFVALRDWAGFSLTGVWATDHGLASTTGLLDIHRMTWDGEALALAGVNGERLPALVGPGGRIGEVTAAAATATGLSAGTPVFAGAATGRWPTWGRVDRAPGRWWSRWAPAGRCG